MHINFRFIASSTLTKAMLAYILLPDEVIGNLQRVRDPAEILALLPPGLRAPLARCRGNDVHQLLTLLRSELMQGQWVALGQQKRNQPVSDKMWAQVPNLNRLRQKLATTEDKHVKAHFKRITDDTVLTPNPIYVPVDPVPDHIIKVELAGQWAANHGELYLGKTEQQDGIFTKPHADIHNGHRSLAKFKNLVEEPKNLYLSIPMQGLNQSMKLLLAENVMPVPKDTDMDEWDNVLVPVVPMHYTTADKDKSKARLYPSGYIYIIWQGKVWREVKIDEKGFFRDIDLNYYRNAQPATTKKTRHVDIALFDEERGCFISDKDFAVYHNGEKIHKGHLDLYGTERVFGLTEDKVEVKVEDCSDDGSTYSTEIDTVESPFKAGRKVLREAEGRPLPHIWVPYKVLGEVQADLKAMYCREQLTTSQLSKLESEEDDRLVALTELAAYSDSQAFDPSQSIVSEVILPTSAEGKTPSLLAGQLDSNIAALYLNSPAPSIRFKYRIDASCDQPDDYFELRCVEDQWSQKVYLREAEFIDEHFKEIVFTGWLPEVKNVDFLRYCAGMELHPDLLPISIYKNIEITELF